MKTGLSLAFWPFSKISVDESVRLLKEKLPTMTQVFRFPPGEGSENFDFNSSKDKSDFLGFVEIVKAFGAKAIVPLNGYHELMYQKYGATYKDKAEIARKSNLAIVDEVFRQNIPVAAWAICNEVYTKSEIHGWKGAYTYKTAANIENMRIAAYSYMTLVDEYKSLIGYKYKYALSMGTDLNISRKTWDSELFVLMNRVTDVLDAHLYPGTTVTGQPLKDLFQKRIGRAASLGHEIICGEVAPNLGMYGTETVNKFARSPEHFARLKEYATVLSGYPNVSAVTFHRAGGIGQNNYNLIQI